MFLVLCTGIVPNIVNLYAGAAAYWWRVSAYIYLNLFKVMTLTFNSTLFVFALMFITLGHYGCSSSKATLSETSTAKPIARVIPSYFTPNGDKDTDTWKIDFLVNYPLAQVRVFDRFGKVVFEAKGNFPANGWDGVVNGAYVPLGNYHYRIDLGNGEKGIMGTVCTYKPEK